MTEPTNYTEWCKREIAALEDENAALESENAALEDDITTLEDEISRLTERIEGAPRLVNVGIWSGGQVRISSTDLDLSKKYALVLVEEGESQ